MTSGAIAAQRVPNWPAPEPGVDDGTPPIRRVAMISLHTSPLAQPGTGDAGGMNVYVTELAQRLAHQGVAVDIFTRATSSADAPLHRLTDNVTVRHVVAGPFEGLVKHELPAQLCVFAREVLRVEAENEPGYYDAVHSHYWLSGQVGTIARDCWGVPLVHSMHTMAKVKNAALAHGDTPEPKARVIGEEQVVAAADMLIANTNDEAQQLVDFYGAHPAQVEVIHPGVDLSMFRPRNQEVVRHRLGLRPDAEVVLFVGRIQPLKAPDVVLHAAAQLLRRHPERRERLVVVVIGGPSGSGLEKPTALRELAAELGISDVVRFVPPASRNQLAQWYAAASLVCVPSHNESFGLVAAEAQAAGTPVVAAAVGGLPTVVADGESGILVAGHDPADYAVAMDRILTSAQKRARLSQGALAQARTFSWEQTADATLRAYQQAAAWMQVERR